MWKYICYSSLFNLDEEVLLVGVAEGIDKLKETELDADSFALVDLPTHGPLFQYVWAAVDQIVAAL